MTNFPELDKVLAPLNRASWICERVFWWVFAAAVVQLILLMVGFDSIAEPLGVVIFPFLVIPPIQFCIYILKILKVRRWFRDHYREQTDTGTTAAD